MELNWTRELDPEVGSVRNDGCSWECPRFLPKPETHFHVLRNILVEAGGNQFSGGEGEPENLIMNLYPIYFTDCSTVSEIDEILL
jgi:hypothetical protein